MRKAKNEIKPHFTGSNLRSPPEAELEWVTWGHVTPQIKKKELKIFLKKKKKKNKPAAQQQYRRVAAPTG